MLLRLDNAFVLEIDSILFFVFFGSHVIPLIDPRGIDVSEINCINPVIRVVHLSSQTNQNEFKIRYYSDQLVKHNLMIEYNTVSF